MDISAAKLLNTASSLMDKLNSMSNKIFEIEDTFRKNSVNFPYHLSVDKNDDREMILSWEKDEKSSKGKFRFFVTTVKDDQTILKKPLMQTTVQQKLELVPFLDTFFDALQSYLVHMMSSCTKEDNA